MIREANKDDDFDYVLSEWKQECNGEKFGIDCDVLIAENHIKTMIGSDRSKVFVLTDNDKVVGLMGMNVLDNPIGKGVMANEHLWYVCKEYRGMKGASLINHAIQWAKDKGCSHIMATASMLASDLHDVICELYENIGMVKFETTYIRRLGV